MNHQRRQFIKKMIIGGVAASSFPFALRGCSKASNVFHNAKTGNRNAWRTGFPVQITWYWEGDWVEENFKKDGYKAFIDMAAEHSPFDLITICVQVAGREVTTQAVHDQTKLAVEYALQRGISMTANLDLRDAAHEYAARYPDEFLETLILKETELSPDSPTEAVVHSIKGTWWKHTFERKPLNGKMYRVYSYQRKNDGIDPETLKDITSSCKATVIDDAVSVSLPSGASNTKACILASFTHDTLGGFFPDVFSPHLLEFQRDIIRQYSDVPLAGVWYGEWGFPVLWNFPNGFFHYSKNRADDYSKRTKGRDLLFDSLLMYLGIKGKERERQMAINHFMEMSWQRNGDIEDDYYRAVKETFGPDAVVLIHPTWQPYPNALEIMRNGLHWWVATRDYAQTDESTPFAVRTALSKKWGSPIWYNQYYSGVKDNYERCLWSNVLGGGRIHYHPLLPCPLDKVSEGYMELLRGTLMTAESKVRFLNYISNSPLDCPVAVIFGHACAMNWAGTAYADVGMKLVENLWCMGIPVDLIPSSEIELESLKIDGDGWICYGKQRYKAVVMYHPEFEKPSTASFFQKAAGGKTHLICKGAWTRDFESVDFNGSDALPAAMKRLDEPEQIIRHVNELLKGNFEPMTASVRIEKEHLVAPPTTGYCRLIDGTLIQVAGTENRAGDAIQSKMNIGKYVVSFDAVGVAAIRLDDGGQVEALAAGGLLSVETGDFKIRLDNRLDLALRKDKQGNWEGIIQGCSDIPKQLLKITKQWTKLKAPVPLI